MKKLLLCLTLLTTLLAMAMPTLAAVSALDGFDPNANGTVRAVAVQPDGKILVGGNFTMLGGQVRNHIGRLNSDGSLDTTFNPGANNTVFSIAVQPDGNILVGGTFTALGGVTGTTPRNFIGRLTSAGSLDATFDPGANNTVVSIAVQPDGKILVGGNFTMLGGGGTGITTRNRIGRLGSDGSLDMAFDPGASAQVLSIVVQANGKILVGGSFTTLGGGGAGITTRNRIGRLGSDGSLDATFDPGANNTVESIVVQADGKILIGGTFTMLGGGGAGTTTRNMIGRLGSDGSLDTTFNPGVNNTVFSIAVQPDGKILVGGNFTMLGGGGTGTTTRNKIGRLGSDGSLDTTFNPGANNIVYSIVVQPDGNILVGGTFTMLGGGGFGTTTRNYIGRLGSDGSLDATLNPGVISYESVYSIAVQPDGKILVGGDFTMLGGQVRKYIGRLNSDGSLDTTFNPGANDIVHSIAVQPDGKILVGGLFTTLGGGGTGTTTRNYIGRLGSDGSLDTTFNPGADNFVYSFTVQADGNILVGGNFTMLGGGGTGTTTRNYIGRLGSDGSLDTTFNPGANSQVRSIAVQPDGKILVGGFFTMLGGGGAGTTTRNYIGRLGSDGSLDMAFNPGANGSVYSLAVQADGKILVGGNISTLGGGGTGTTTRNYIGRLGSDGSLDTTFNPGANSTVYAFAVQADGKILVGGTFTMLGGGGAGTTTRNYIGRLGSNGSLDTSFDPGASGRRVNSIVVQTDGKILVGGWLITTLGGQPRPGIGRLTNTDAALQDLQVASDGRSVTWKRSGASPEVWRVTFEDSSDGTTWTTLDEGERIAGGWQLTGLTLPIGQNYYLRARGYATGGYYNGSGSLIESVKRFYLPPGVVTYSGNGSSGTVPSPPVAYRPGDTVTVAGNTNADPLVKTGYTFSGWNSAPDGSGTNYAAADTFAIAGDITLYAKWTINTYSIGTSVTGGNGDINCTTPIAFGGTSNCTISNITAGYHLATFTDNTVNKLASVAANAYSITNVTADHTVAGTFIMDGVCGSSHGAPLTIAPTLNLCATGAESAVTGSGPWFWTCGGGNGGSTAHCSAYLPGTVLIPKTGQTKCYDPTGNTTNEISCAGTGQDGEKRAGAAQTDPVFTDNGNGTITDKVYGMTWQKDAGTNRATIKTGIVGVPAVRFTDNGNGTQTDNLTGLVWLKDLSCFNTRQKWQDALTSANTLKGDGPQCSLTDGSVAGDWRLPNVDELASVATNYSGTPVAWLNNAAQGFSGVQSYIYWSGSTYSSDTAKALFVDMQLGGHAGYVDKIGTFYVWPVRGGQAGSLGNLIISKSGTGTGSVSSVPAGITCGATCSASFAKGQAVVLTATAGGGSALASWTGCNSIDVNNKCTVAASGAKSVTAAFELTYSVSYDGNGNTGTSGPNNAVGLYIPGATVTVLGNTFTRTGYTFAGWYPAADGSGTAYGASFIMGSANTTLYAKWTDITVPIANPETVSTAYNTAKLAIDVLANDSDNSGTVLLGTISNQVGGTFVVNAGKIDFTPTPGFSGAASCVYQVKDPTGNVSTATLTVNVGAMPTYNVTYNGNTNSGGSAPVDISSYANGATVTVLGPGTLQKTGYTFAGWYPNADGSGTAYGASFTMGSADTQLFAKWTINSYSVSFTSNGGSAVGSQTVAYNTVATAPIAPTKPGYAFAGWYSDAAMTTAFNITTPITADTSLYAKWTINSYSVSFTSNGGSAVTSQSVAYNTVATAPAAPAKPGYTFAGWYSEVVLTTAFNFATPITIDTTLYAKWSINSYSVTFTSNGDSAVGSQTVAYNTVATAPIAPTKPGYAFAGWYSDVAMNSAFSFVTPITADTTLYAKWSINSYSISFTSNGGSAVTSQAIAYNTVATAPIAPTKPGYTFAGWYSDAAMTTAFNFATPITTDTQLYAKWNINSYSVSFTSNGGSVVTSQTVAYNTVATAPAAPTKPGYIFAGWYSDAAMTAAFDFTNAITNDTTLYAKWIINSYVVTFNNGGSTIDSQNVLYNTTAVPVTPARTGYTFGGWYTDAALTAVFNFALPITGDVTLYAKWTIGNYSVSFTSNGGTAVSSQNVVYNNTVAMPSAPVNAGAIFVGWYSDAALTTAFNFTTPITGNTTLYAKWTVPVTYSVYPASGTGIVTTPDSVQTVASGGSTSFTITPEPGYGILSVTGCNGSLSGRTYTTGAITGNCAVVATAVKHNGNSNTDAAPALADAMKALQAVLGNTTLTPEETIRYDVAPLAANGVPQGNGAIDIADVIMILRRSVGIGNW